MSDGTDIKVGSRWRCRWDGGSRHEVIDLTAGVVTLRDRRGGSVTSVGIGKFKAGYLPLDRSEPDPVDNPAHYKGTAVEPIAAIEAWGLGFCLGNAVKYIARAGKKGDRLEDLRKARWYLDREIEKGESK